MMQSGKRKFHQNSLLENTEELSHSQLKRLQDELSKSAKSGKVSIYYRNKIANSLSKEFNVSNVVIQNWFKSNAPKVPHAKVTAPKPVTEEKECTSSSSLEKEIERKGNKPILVSLEESSLDLNNSTPEDSLSSSQNPLADEKLQSLRMKYDELLAEHKEKVAYCDTLKEKCHDFIETYNSHNAEKEEELKDYKQKLFSKEKEIQKLKVSHVLQESEAKNKILELQKKMEEQNLTLLVIKEKLKSKEDLLKKKEDECSNFEFEKKLMLSKQEEIYDKVKNMLTKKQTELDESEKICENLRLKYSALEEKNAELSEGILILNKANTELMEKLNTKDKELDSKDTELEKVNKSLIEIIPERKELMKSVSTLEKECESKSQKNMELNQQVNILKANLKSKSVELQWALDKQTEIEKKSKEKDVKLTKLQDIIVKRRNQIRDLEEHELALQQTIHRWKNNDSQIANKMEQTLAEKDKELQDCKSDLLRAQNLARRSIQSCKELNVKKSEDISDLINQLNIKTVQLENKERHILELNEDIKVKQQQCENARKSIESFLELNEKKDKEISSLKNDGRDMILRLEHADKEILELERKDEANQQFCENLKVNQLAISVENNNLRKDLHQSQQLTREKDIEIVHLQKKLNTETLERDVKISEQEEELRTLNSRMDDQKEEFERELARGQELQLCEEERKHSLLAEMESNKLKAEERLRELEAEAQLEAVKRAEIAKKLEEKKMLVRKMKTVLLYRPSDGRAAEKSSQPSTSTSRLQLGYNWPLHPRPHLLLPALLDNTGTVRGWKRKLEQSTDQSCLPKKIFRLINDSLDMKNGPIKHFLPMFEIQSQKRKSLEFHFVERKRPRVISQLMLTQDGDHSRTTPGTSYQMIAELLLDLLFSH